MLAHWHWLWVDVKRAFLRHAIRRWGHLGRWGSLQRGGGITPWTFAMPWTLQHPAPCVRCTDSSSGGLGSPPSFILKWELKATPEQPAPHVRGLSLHVDVPCCDPGRAVSWQYRCPLPATQGTSVVRATCKPARYLYTAASLSLQMAASLQAL